MRYRNFYIFLLCPMLVCVVNTAQGEKAKIPSNGKAKIRVSPHTSFGECDSDCNANSQNKKAKNKIENADINEKIENLDNEYKEAPSVIQTFPPIMVEENQLGLNIRNKIETHKAPIHSFINEQKKGYISNLQVKSRRYHPQSQSFIKQGAQPGAPEMETETPLYSATSPPSVQTNSNNEQAPTDSQIPNPNSIQAQGQQQSFGSNQQPSGTNQQPQVSNPLPSVSNQQPSVSNQQPPVVAPVQGGPVDQSGLGNQMNQYNLAIQQLKVNEEQLASHVVSHQQKLIDHEKKIETLLNSIKTSTSHAENNVTNATESIPGNLVAAPTQQK